jgi:hypothetical protein
MIKLKRNPKCDLCNNRISDDPYKLVVECGADGDIDFTICDECGTLIETMRNKFQENMNESIRTAIDEQSI